ncbi:hypothetical protein BgiBS90_033719 [Biomphalaria glabrata]|nr:hypothetical protein BgiBS90_033719 [Biomphalaria glabrata]
MINKKKQTTSELTTPFQQSAPVQLFQLAIPPVIGRSIILTFQLQKHKFPFKNESQEAAVSTPSSSQYDWNPEWSCSMWTLEGFMWGYKRILLLSFCMRRL